MTKHQESINIILKLSAPFDLHDKDTVILKYIDVETNKKFPKNLYNLEIKEI